MNEQMIGSPAWARRVSVVLLALLAAAAVTVLSAGGAEASHCREGLFWTDTGAGVVGVKHNEAGPTTRSVSVCADPPHQEQGVGFDVGVAAGVAPDLSSAGALAGAGICSSSLGCTTLLNTTGATVSAPSASADEPLDGDNVVGASVNMGGGVCAWANGSPTGCQLGGSSNTYFTGGDPSPLPSVHPAVDPLLAYVHYTAFYGAVGYALWCAGLPFYFGVDGIAILCALGAAQVAGGGVNAVLYPVAIGTTGDAYSNGGVAVSGLGNASGGTVAVAPEGNASSSTATVWTPLGTGVPVPGAAVAGTGDADAHGGLIAVSGQGHARGGAVNLGWDGTG